jgi:hypothetical protein
MWFADRGRKGDRGVSFMLLVAPPAVFLCSLLLRTQLIRFAFDDFEFAINQRSMGFLGQLRNAYFGFSGRLILVTAGGPLTAAGSRFASMVVLLLMALLFAASVGLLGRLFANTWGLQRRTAYCAACWTVALLASNVPARGQVFFWVIGTLVYLAPLTCTCLALWWVVSSRRSVRATIMGRLASPVAVVLTVLGAGGNETIAVAAPFGLLAIMLIAERQSGIRGRALGLLPFACAGSMLLFGAPGQRNRSTWIPTERSSGRSMGLVMEMVSAIVNLVVSNVGAVVAAFLLGVAAGCAGDGGLDSRGVRAVNRASSGRSRRVVGAVGLITAVSWIAIIVIASFGSMAIPPQRAIALPWLLTLLFVTLLGTGSADAIVQVVRSEGVIRRMTTDVSPHVSPLVGALVTLMSLWVVAPATLDHVRLTRQLDCVERTVQQATDTSTPIYVAAPQTVNDVWYVLPDPSQWPNKYMASYFGTGPISNDASRSPGCKVG